MAYQNREGVGNTAYQNREGAPVSLGWWDEGDTTHPLSEPCAPIPTDHVLCTYCPRTVHLLCTCCAWLLCTYCAWLLCTYCAPTVHLLCMATVHVLLKATVHLLCTYCAWLLCTCSSSEDSNCASSLTEVESRQLSSHVVRLPAEVSHTLHAFQQKVKGVCGESGDAGSAAPSLL